MQNIQALVEGGGGADWRRARSDGEVEKEDGSNKRNYPIFFGGVSNLWRNK